MAAVQKKEAHGWVGDRHNIEAHAMMQYRVATGGGGPPSETGYRVVDDHGAPMPADWEGYRRIRQ